MVYKFKSVILTMKIHSLKEAFKSQNQIVKIKKDETIITECQRITDVKVIVQPKKEGQFNGMCLQTRTESMIRISWRRGFKCLGPV